MGTTEERDETGSTTGIMLCLTHDLWESHQNPSREGCQIDSWHNENSGKNGGKGKVSSTKNSKERIRSLEAGCKFKSEDLEFNTLKKQNKIEQDGKKHGMNGSQEDGVCRTEEMAQWLAKSCSYRTQVQFLTPKPGCSQLPARRSDSLASQSTCRHMDTKAETVKIKL